MPETMNPALQAFTDAAPDDQSQEWAGDVSTRVNDFLMRRQINEQNEAAGNAFVGKLDTIKQNYVGMVQDDPSTYPLALDLVRPTVNALVGSIPGVGPAELQGHHDAISSHIEQEVARTAVRTAAEQSHDGAREILDNVSHLLPDDERSSLSNYIGVQAQARQMDNGAQAIMSGRAQQQAQDHAAWNYLGALVNPDNGEVQYPKGWAQRVIADQTLPPAPTAALVHTYARLQEQGDAPASDPFLASRLVSDLAGDNKPALPDILRHAGEGLRLADALTVAGFAIDDSRGGQDRLAQLHALMQNAQGEIAPPENGVAGQMAYGRFVNWLLPRVRGGAVMNPEAQDYLLAGNRMQSFAPNPVDNAVAPRENRPSLDQIFGGRRVG